MAWQYISPEVTVKRFKKCCTVSAIFFLIHPYLLPYSCCIPVHTLFNLPRNRRTAVVLYCLSLSHSFITSHPYTHWDFGNCLCHCHFPLRSLLLVVPSPLCSVIFTLSSDARDGRCTSLTHCPSVYHRGVFSTDYRISK